MSLAKQIKLKFLLPFRLFNLILAGYLLRVLPTIKRAASEIPDKYKAYSCLINLNSSG